MKIDALAPSARSTFQRLKGLSEIKLFYLPYKSLFRAINFQGIKISDLRDLAVMKLQAIGSRGTRRDFVDLYVILLEKKWGIEQILKWHHKKYAGADISPIFLLKSLTYFGDADNDRSLEMIKPVDWEIVKKYFQKIVREVKL